MLKNQKAIVTGGLKGIGKGVSEALLRNGAMVAIVDIADHLWHEINNDWTNKFPNGQFYYVKCDLFNRQSTISAFKEAYEILDGLNIVINNAGIYDESDWERSIDINLKAMIRVAYIGINLMSKEKGHFGGTIINSASGGGLSTVGFPSYCAAKHGVTSFTRSMSAIPEFYKLHGVRINSMCLGAVHTDMTQQHDLRQSEELDALPSLHLVNKIKREIVNSMSSEDMIPLEKAGDLYVKLIRDTNAHGENMIYISKYQKEPYYHEFKGLN